MHIVEIASEMAPFAKVGGLADVLLGLSHQLNKLGHRTEVILPKYDLLDHALIDDFQIIHTNLWINFKGRSIKNTIWMGKVYNIVCYFIDPETDFFSRKHIYGSSDDAERFLYFSKAALEFLILTEKIPDIIHIHDWHTAVVAPLFFDLYQAKHLYSTKIVFTIHNLQYQGCIPAQTLSSIGLNPSHYLVPEKLKDPYHPECINLMKGGIVYANAVTTVSPTYANEAKTAERGEGLHPVILKHQYKFCGILNGIDYDFWNPSTDSYLPFQMNSGKDFTDFTQQFKKFKQQNKIALQKQFKLESSHRPIVGVVTRLSAQKGLELLKHTLFRTLELEGQFILLGSQAEEHTQLEFESMKYHFDLHPHAHLELSHNEHLTHLIYAGSDFLIVPSLFEPCGLTQLIALRYGTIPITRQTGGLNDTVFDIDFSPLEIPFRNGFSFKRPNATDLNSALDRAIECYYNNEQKWNHIFSNAIQSNHSWEKPTLKYLQIFQKTQEKSKKEEVIGA